MILGFPGVLSEKILLGLLVIRRNFLPCKESAGGKALDDRAGWLFMAVRHEPTRLRHNAEVFLVATVQEEVNEVRLFQLLVLPRSWHRD